MPLISFWRTAREEVLKLSIEQVVSSAGDGVIRDQSACSTEFRQFLAVAPVESLFGYARYSSGLNFQQKWPLFCKDIVNVNEFGKAP